MIYHDLRLFLTGRAIVRFFFERIWKSYQIAVITYRKNVTSVWDDTEFEDVTVCIEGNTTTMKLAEKEVEINHVRFREVRKLSDDGHQTSVITTNRKLSIAMIAYYMFSRWCQENFFRYMRQNYDFDKMLQYTVEQLDGNILVNHPTYSKIIRQIGKTREKIARREAKLYRLIEKEIAQDLQKEQKKNQAHQQLLQSEIEQLQLEAEQLIQERKKYPAKVKIKDMPGHIRYNQLCGESKHFQNIIKIICFRSETAFANLLTPHYKRASDEIREFVKTIIKTPINLHPDYDNNRLIVTLYSLSTPRQNYAVNEILDILNASETKFPGTELTVFYKTTTS